MGIRVIASNKTRHHIFASRGENQSDLKIIFRIPPSRFPRPLPGEGHKGPTPPTASPLSYTNHLIRNLVTLFFHPHTSTELNKNVNQTPFNRKSHFLPKTSHRKQPLI